MVYANSIHTKQLHALLPGIILHWFGAAYELQLVSYGHEMVPQYTRHSRSDTTVASVYIFWVLHV